MAKADLEMAQGDTLPVFTAICKLDGVAFPLTGSTCRIHVRKVRGELVLDRVMTLGGDVGEVEYDWLGGVDETEDFLGDYEVEVEANFGGGQKITFPNTHKKPIITFNRQLG